MEHDPDLASPDPFAIADDGGTLSDADVEAGWDVPDRYAPDGECNLDLIDAKESLAQWKIEAVGRRPQDFFVRDLLHSSLLRDRRPRFFHRYYDRPGKWMSALVEHLPSEDQAAAVAHVALHFLHRRQLVALYQRWLETPIAERQTDPDYRQIYRLWECEPTGVLLSWNDPNGSIRSNFQCGIPRLCPWCHARRALDLHRRLQKGPMKDLRGKFLVQARIEVIGEEMGLDDDWLEAVLTGQDVYQGLTEDDENVYLLDRRHTTFMRDRLGRVLLREAEALGVRGGFLSYHVGPGRGLLQNYDTFRHELNLVGEVTFGSNLEKARVERRMGLNQETHPVLEVADRYFPVWWLMMPADVPQALRFMVAGSSLSYPVEKLGLQTNDCGCPEHLLNDGVPGALALQPTFMFLPDEWDLYAPTLKGRQLFTTFGSWRGRATGGCPGAGTGWTRGAGGRASATRGQSAGVIPPQGLNQERQVAAAQRRARLLEMARTALATTTSPGQRGRGRPAKRKHLAEILLALGEKVSMRDLKWLRQELYHSER